MSSFSHVARRAVSCHRLIKVVRLLRTSAVLFLVASLFIAVPCCFGQTASSTVSGQSRDTEDILKVDTNLVTILFSAINKNHQFLTSLQANDLQVYEGDVQQKVSIFQRETELPLAR